MPEQVVKQPTELDSVKKQLDNLEAKVQQMDDELEQVKIKTGKRPSIGFFRARFKA